MSKVKYTAIGVPVFLVLCLSAFKIGYVLLKPEVANINNVAPAPLETFTIPYKVWIVSKTKDGGVVDIQATDHSVLEAGSMTLQVTRNTEEALEEGDEVEVTVKFLPKKVK